MDIDTLRRLLSYDGDTGALTWRSRTPDLFQDAPGRAAVDQCRTWNSRFAGRPALNGVSRYGYKVGAVLNGKFLAHRVAWALHHGEWPRGEIDHRNGDRADNRIANLRDVSSTINGRNCGRGRRNTSGRAGVYFDKSRGRWMAYISHRGKMQNLGRFRCFTAAELARLAAQSAIGGYTDRHGV